ncbi:hypothetical protein BDR22DRAFT_895436 [Usnea florida]
MVGCKDDPSYKLRNLPSLHQQSPTQDEQDTRLDRWFHTLSHTPTTTPIRAQDNPALQLQSVSRSHPIKHSRPSTNAQSNKRKALTELEPLHPRKSARLEHKQPVPAYQMSTSPTKKKAGKAREASAYTQNKDEEQAGVSHVVTRGRSQGKVTTETSSDKENHDRARGIATALPTAESAVMTRPLLRPVAVSVPELDVHTTALINAALALGMWACMVGLGALSANVVERIMLLQWSVSKGHRLIQCDL